jgi:molybdopterin-synthase adenylyltransferase
VGLLEDAAARPGLSEGQLERYASNLAFFSTFATLRRSRFKFQEALRHARVLLLGVGGLGSTLLFDLAGLGVGHVTLVDVDRVELRNFSRQFLYDERDVGQVKVFRAAERVRRFNREMDVVPVPTRIESARDVAELAADVELVLSAIDQPDTVQDWVNEACVAARVPFVSGGMQAARGVYYSVHPGRSGCLACAKAAGTGPQRPQRVNRGIGPVASLMGGLVALEATRYLTGFAPPVSAGRQWLVDFATGQVAQAFEWERLLDCPVCSSIEHFEGASE